MSLLERELREQPAALARLLERQGEHADKLATLLRRRDVRYLLIASRGSSSNAARYAQYLLGRAQQGVTDRWKYYKQLSEMRSGD